MDTRTIAADGTAAWQTVIDYGPRVAGALLVLVVGVIIANWLSAIALRGLARTRIDPTFRPMIANTVNYLGLAIVALIVLQQFGVQTASLLALLGTAGLAIGLALQGTLSNVAAGFVLLILRPFEVGDSVKISDQTGTVIGLALFQTLLRSADGNDIFVPNTNVLQNAIINMSRDPASLLTVTLNVAAGADLDVAVRVMLETLESQPLVSKSLDRTVTVDGLSAASSQVTASAWVRNAESSQARTQYLCALRIKLKAAGIALA